MVIKYRLRLYIFTFVMLIGFAALAQRLWNLTIERHDEFVNKIPGTKELDARIPGTRGEIKDRNGFVLVTNRPSYEVTVNLKMLVDEYYREIKSKDKKAELPKIEFQYMEKGVPRSRKETDIVKIVEDTVISNLKRMKLATTYNPKKLRIHYRTTRGVIPWVYRQDLTFEEFSEFAEHRLGLAGVNVNARPVRLYLFDSMLCHVLGYVNQADIKRASDAERKDWDSFYVPDDYGVTGVEKAFDNELRGKPGVLRVLQDERGHIVRSIPNDDPPPPRKPDVERLLLSPNHGAPSRGHDVYLTIDARIQYLAEKALRESNPQIGRGAVVVLQPESGEVLAMASVPSYNPNKFIPKISQDDYDAYYNNLCVPLLNRAVRAFAPGSTYKVMISFAGIMAKIEHNSYNCPGGITYGNKYMKCWIAEHGGAHGTLDLTGGLKNSCNCFFYQYGNAAGIHNIEKAGHMFGMGERTGIELQEEDPGVLPNPQWLKIHSPNENWSHGTTANTSIGQGYVLATPLQMAGVAAAVGNGGTPFKPHLLKKVLDGSDVLFEQKPEPRANFTEYGLTPQKLELVRKGMWKVVNEEGGTARTARIAGVELAGKTGTAQAWRDDENHPGVRVKDNHTLFICFAPYVHPKYAVCILVEGGKSGGGCAAPIARRIIEQALELEQKGFKVPVAPLAEVKGNFNHIETVSYENIQPVVMKPNEDPDQTNVNDDTADIITPKAIPIPADVSDRSESFHKPQDQKPAPEFKAPDSGDHRHLFGR